MLERVRIFNFKFVNKIKLKDNVPFMKSRLVIQAYNDNKKKLVLMQLFTI
jgi:hypothetical protein